MNESKRGRKNNSLKKLKGEGNADGEINEGYNYMVDVVNSEVQPKGAKPESFLVLQSER